MSQYVVTDTELTAVADAIRSKGGTEADLEWPSAFVSAIGAITTGSGGDSQSSGDSAKNILGGTTVPTSAEGHDGDIYIQYAPVGIKNSSGNVIQTGYSGNTNTKIVCDFMIDEAQTGEYPTLFGGRPNGGNVANAIAYQFSSGSYAYTNGFAVWNANNQISGAGCTPLLKKKAHVELSNGSFKLNAFGIDIDSQFSTANISASTGILLFGHNVNGSPQPFGATKGIIIYRFQVYESDVLVHDFVPAKDTNNVVCIYDEVAEEYKYPASGTMDLTDDGGIVGVYLKDNGAWIILEDGNWSDVNTEGSGGGSTNILSGTDIPTASLGNDGAIYLRYAENNMYEDSGLGWYAKKEYVVKDTTTNLWRGWTKSNTVPSIAVLYHGGGWYGVEQLSTDPDGVKHTNNTSPLGSAVVDGTTWYLSTHNNWDRSESTHDIPLFEDPQGRYDSPSTLIPLILSEADAHIGTIPEGNYIVIEVYAKINGAWQNLIGTDIDDVNTGGSDSLS